MYEQAAEYREIGAGVGLGINAAKLMHIIPGVGAGMNSIEGRGESDNSWFTFVRWDTGEKIVHVDGPVKDTEWVRPCSMARNEFLDVLLGVIRDRDVASLHTKKKFVSVKVCICASLPCPDGTLEARDLSGSLTDDSQGSWRCWSRDDFSRWHHCHCRPTHRE